MLSLFLSFIYSYTLCVYEGNAPNKTECDESVEYMYTRNYDTKSHFDEIILSNVRRAITIPLSILTGNAFIKVNGYSKEITFNSNKVLETYPSLEFDNDIDVTLTGILPMNYPQIKGTSRKPNIKYTRMILEEDTIIMQKNENTYSFKSASVYGEDVMMHAPAFLLNNNMMLTIYSHYYDPKTKVTIDVAPDKLCNVSSELQIEEISLGKGSTLYTDMKTTIAPLAAISITFSFDHLSYLDVQKPVEGEAPFISVNYEEDVGSQRFLPSYRIAHIIVQKQWISTKVTNNGGSWNKNKIDYDFNPNYHDGFIDIESYKGRYCNLYNQQLCGNFTYVNDDDIKIITGIRYLKIDKDVSLSLEQVNGGLYVEGWGLVTLKGKGTQIPKITTSENVRVLLTEDLAFDGESDLAANTSISILRVVTKKDVYIDVLSDNVVKIVCGGIASTYTFKNGIVIDAHDNQYVDIRGNGFALKELDLKSCMVSIRNALISKLLCYAGAQVLFNENVSFTEDGVISINFHLNYRPEIIIYQELKTLPKSVFISYDRKSNFGENGLDPFRSYDIITGVIGNIPSIIPRETLFFDHDEKLIKGRISITDNSVTILFAKQRKTLLNAERVCYNPDGGKCPNGFKRVRTLLGVSNIKELYITANAYVTNHQLFANAINVSGLLPSKCVDPIFQKENSWLSLMTDELNFGTLQVDNANVYIYNKRAEASIIEYIIGSGVAAIYGHVRRITAKAGAEIAMMSPAYLLDQDVLLESNSRIRFTEGSRNSPKSVTINGYYSPGRSALEGCEKGFAEIIKRKCRIVKTSKYYYTVFPLNDDEL